MRVLLQRVKSASVEVAAQQIAAIDAGLLAFVGVFPADGPEQINWLADKLLGLRIFADRDANMNLSLVDIAGELLVVSQFTLAADTTRGRRPRFSTAATPAHAQHCVAGFIDAVSNRGVRVAAGRFGADMQVALVNDGPVTFLLER